MALRERTIATFVRSGFSVPLAARAYTTLAHYVIGFAVSNIQDNTPIQCETLAANPATFASTCSDPTKQALYGPCCTLEKIAAAGGTNKAYFAATASDLSAALADIIGKIGRKLTTRTVPAYSPQVADVADTPAGLANSSVYMSAFSPSPGAAWSGNVLRQRYLCDSAFTLTTPTIDDTKGDDFAQNLNNGSGGKYSDRRFVAIEPADTASSGKAPAAIWPRCSSTSAERPVWRRAS